MGSQRTDDGGRPRVVLADDHRDMLVRVAALLASEFTVVAAVADGEALVVAEADLSTGRPRDRHHDARDQRARSGRTGAPARVPCSDRFPVDPRGAGVRPGGASGRRAGLRQQGPPRQRPDSGGAGSPRRPALRLGRGGRRGETKSANRERSRGLRPVRERRNDAVRNLRRQVPPALQHFLDRRMQFLRSRVLEEIR